MTTWVLVTVPLLVASLLLLVLHLPSLAGDMAQSAGGYAGSFGDALRTGEATVAAVNGLALLALAVPAVGLTVTLVRAVRRLCDPQLSRRIGKAVLTYGAPR